MTQPTRISEGALQLLRTLNEYGMYEYSDGDTDAQELIDIGYATNPDQNWLCSCEAGIQHTLPTTQETQP